MLGCVTDLTHSLFMKSFGKVVRPSRKPCLGKIIIVKVTFIIKSILGWLIKDAWSVGKTDEQ